MKLKNWKAKRAGGRITINGVAVGEGHGYADGDPVKIVGVDKIEPATSTHKSFFGEQTVCIAHDKDGETHGLFG